MVTRTAHASYVFNNLLIDCECAESINQLSFLWYIIYDL